MVLLGVLSLGRLALVFPLFASLISGGTVFGFFTFTALLATGAICRNPEI